MGRHPGPFVSHVIVDDHELPSDLLCWDPSMTCFALIIDLEQ